MVKTKHSYNYSNFLLFLLCFFIIFLLFRWVHFLLNKNYLQPGTYLESFTSLSNAFNTNTNGTNSNASNAIMNNSYKVNYIHSNNINMPISAFSEYTCSNSCGPLSRCILTSEQCSFDGDCTGCQDMTALNNYKENSPTDHDKNIPKGANEYILSNNPNDTSFARFTMFN